MKSVFLSYHGVILAFACLSPAASQECRLTALSPAQPPASIEEGERALESQTFQTGVLALSPSDTVHFFDSASRIRRIEANGRITTLAGTSVRGDTIEPGPAHETSLPNVTQIFFNPDGVLHFVAAGRIFRIAGNDLDTVAGSGRPGFNGEEGRATEVNLGTIVNGAFSHAGELLILDGFNRVRRLEADGTLRTIAGSTRAAAATGFTGDNGPATQASLSSPRQIVPLRDGSLWIKDLSGRHLRILTPDGIIRTINQNFEASVNILMFPDGAPAAATANRVYPIRSNGAIETGASPYPPFTGTPLTIGSDGALYFLGSTRPDQRNPLLRLHNRMQTVIAGAPVPAELDGQSPPFGIWNLSTNSLIYPASIGRKSGVLEARPGQTARFIAGGGDDNGDAEGKTATSLSIFGIVAFSLDGEGNVIIADVYRRRILVAAPDGKVSVLKNESGEHIIYTPLGSLSTLQRIAADAAGNIYWFSQGATPAGGVFTAEVSVWSRANSAVTSFTVQGLSAIARLEDGNVAAIAGNGANFRTAYRVSPSGLGEVLPSFRMLPLQSVTHWKDQSYFTAATRLFRGQPGEIEMLDIPPRPGTPAFIPDFVLATPADLLVHLTDGGFYRIDGIEACRWLPQPRIAAGGVLNAASFEFPNTISPRQLITIFGSGLGPASGQGLVLDGALRAGGQPAPYPALLLGNFSGANPNATLTGTALPVVYSSDTHVTVQAVTTTPASGEYLLYFAWQGLQLIHSSPIKVQALTPGLFTNGGLAAAVNEDGIRHSAANPALPGSLVRLFGTGFGAIDTNLPLGDFNSTETPPRLTSGVTLSIGGQSAQVEFAGGAAGLIGGVNEIRARIPEGLSPGLHPVALKAGEADAPLQQVTLAVK